ncbi:MAG: GGDEF domain-containing protein [Lachnospiraceae bacterium]|nr:GGDEF domain-containing protein [Lachnospiraceae bacterium]
MISNYIRSIESEYEKMSRHWLDLHANICVCVTAIAFLLEVILFFVLDSMDMVSTTAPIYIRRYVVVPTGLNLLILLIIWLVRKKYPKRLTLRAYTVSLGLVGICFIVFTIHSIFPSLYFLFAIPLLFSGIYGNYVLTSVTAACTFAARIIGDIVINWDSATVLVWEYGYDWVDFALSLMVLAGFYLSCMIMIYFEQEKRNATVKKETERIQFRQGMIIDQLTSLYNRTALNDVLTDVERADAGMICAMIKAEHLLEINDRSGHLAGDEYLRKVSSILRSVCDQHLAFRYSGDKFCVLFTGISQEEARSLCRRVCKESAKIMENGSTERAATVSYGLAILREGQSPESLLLAADEDLERKRAAQ